MPIKELGPSDWYKKTFNPNKCSNDTFILNNDTFVLDYE